MSVTLEEERELRVSLEEKLENIEESHNDIIAKIIKKRNHAIAKYKMCKKEKVELGVVHSRLTEDLEKLSKAHKALESENSTLTKSLEQLQAQPSKNDAPSSSTSTCDHANIIEENARLKASLAKAVSQGKKPRGTPHNNKEGLSYVAPVKKKEKFMKDARPAQTKKSNISSGGATRGKTTRDDFAGNDKPHYIFYVDYYGAVYAKFVGPRDVSIARSIWVPKTLFAKKRGPIRKWVPRTKK